MSWEFKGECEPLPNHGSSQFQIWDDGRIIAVVVSTEDKSVGVTEGIANANIMAASLDLLAACQAAHEGLQRIHKTGLIPWDVVDVGWGVKVLGDAIAKAVPISITQGV